MKPKNRETILSILATLLLSIFFILAFFFATDAKIWYAGEHDSQCEEVLNETRCNCHDRLVKQERQK